MVTTRSNMKSSDEKCTSIIESVDKIPPPTTTNKKTHKKTSTNTTKKIPKKRTCYKKKSSCMRIITRSKSRSSLINPPSKKKSHSIINDKSSRGKQPLTRKKSYREMFNITQQTIKKKLVKNNQSYNTTLENDNNEGRTHHLSTPMKVTSPELLLNQSSHTNQTRSNKEAIDTSSRRRIISKVKDRSSLISDILDYSSSECSSSPSSKNTDTNEVIFDNNPVSVIVTDRQETTTPSSSTAIENLSKGFTFPSNAIILPRKCNKSIPKDSNLIFTNENINKYTTLVNTDVCVEYSLSSNKNKFLMDFIETTFYDYEVYEFQEKTNDYDVISDSRLNAVVTRRLNTLVAKVGVKNIPKLKKVAGKKAVIKKDKKVVMFNNSGCEYTYGAYYSKLSRTAFRCYYPDVVELDGNKSWNFYSMFHSAYQSFSFVVYNYSHRLANGQPVHRSTRVKLVFPDNANCILIIHGRLVHCGAASKPEGPSSFNASHDLRLFAYLSNLNTRQERVKKYEHPLAQDVVDTNTFRRCELSCNKCKNITDESLQSDNDIETIYIGKLLQERRDLMTTPRNYKKQLQSKLIVGNMQELGWEVHSGIDTNLDKYTNLQSHFREAVIGKGKDSWNGINSTQRRAFKIDKLLGEQNSIINNTLPLIIKLYDDILTFILKKNSYLGKNIQYDGRALLANFDFFGEQNPHRDFSQTKIQEDN